MSRPSVSIVIPAKDGRPVIAPCLDAVRRQEYDGQVEVIVVDSGSTDGTLDDIAERPWVRLHSIHPSAFDHGDTRNLGIGLTSGELIVLLVQDAEPTDEHWLSNLVRNLEADENVAGAFSRILPRPYAGPLVKKGCEGDLCFGTERVEARATPEEWAALDPHTRRLRANFNDVSSCIRRSIWERLPLERGMFGEDIKFARAAVAAGYTVVFDPTSQVLHSHEYEARTVYARTKVDAEMNEVVLGRTCIASFRDAMIMTGRFWKADREALKSMGLSAGERLKWSLFSPVYHCGAFLGFWKGGKQVRDAGLQGPAPEPKPLAVERARKLKILMVVHGFPPDSWAGVEVLSLTLARALRRRGHEVVFFVRSPGSEDEADRSLQRSEFDGFVVHRYVNRLAFTGVDETYRFRPAEDAFDRVARAEQPDVVHVQHMIHLSTGILDRCRALGLPSLVMLSDFWARCPRVQLIRPDKRNCTVPPPGLGCAACVKDKPGLIEPLARLDRLAGKWPRRWAESVPQSSPPHPPGWKKSKEDAASLLRRETWMRDVLLRADRLVVPSFTLQRSLMELGISRERIALAAYGMDTTWVGDEPLARTARAAGAPLRVGFIGSIVWYKGLEVLAEAVAGMPAGSVQVHVHGDHEGGADPGVRAEVSGVVGRARHIADDKLVFHGRFDHEKLPDIHAELDVLVVPSIWQEAYGITVREAHLAGTPVVGSDIAGIAEGIRHDVDGLLFRTGDAAHLREQLQRLIDEPGLGARLVAAAPPVKTDDEEAVEMEWRYRQLVCAREGARRAAGGTPQETSP